ncbi:MAG: hypothetical protein KDK66_05390 [Deltaproteobacteria bacterium]|nr:hypothetical protein [Deltaproteobacteria bacterium]
MTPYQIIALGDSLTYGYPFGPRCSWVASLSQALGQPILNQGVNGDCLQDMLARLDRDVLDLCPKHCLILGGSNDFYQGIPYEKIKLTYLKILEELKEEKVQAWIGLPPPVREKKVEKQLQTFRNWLVRLSRQLKVPRLDFYKAFVHPKSGRIKAGVLEDEVHPSLAGYEMMGEVVRQTIGV